MHSRIFVIREVVLGKNLPPMDNCTRVTEDELADALVPHTVDYVNHITDAKDFAEDINWLTTAEPCFQVTRKDNQTFITLSVTKGLDILKAKRLKFLECVEQLNDKEWCSPHSMLRYEMSQCVDEDHGFFMVTVTEDMGWWYETFDEWLRSTCGKFVDSNAIAFISFRVEDTFDYHF